MTKTKKLVYNYNPIGISGYGQFTIKRNDQQGTPLYIVPVALEYNDEMKWFRKAQAERKAMLICDMFDIIKKEKPQLIIQFDADLAVTFEQIKDKIITLEP